MDTTSEDDRLWKLVIEYKDAGDLPHARDTMLKLVDRNPGTTGYRNYLGHLYWRLGELDSAIDTFRTATAMSPKSERASLGLFHCLWEQERREDAIAEVMRFLTVADSEDYRAILEELSARLP